VLRFAPLAFFLSLIVALALGLSNNPKKMPSTLIDRALPVFMLAHVNGGGSLSNTDIKGEIALVNVFASWCPVCRMEHPILENVAVEGGLKIYGVDWKDTRQGALRWLKAYGNPYAKIGFDETGRVGVDLGVTGVPETFLVDPTGRVRYRHAGPLTAETWEAVFEPLIKTMRSIK
jgi:cytochrome c biogenesis protein CcmG/thiol:disulfide interchange protein DsbE